MLHHWLHGDNEWAEILGLFEAYLWILRQIFPLQCLFLWTANVRGWKEREQEMWEGQKVRGLGFFAAAQGFIPAPVLWLGSTPHSHRCGDTWDLLERGGPRIHPWENTSGLCFSDSRGLPAAGTGLWAKQEWPRHKSQDSGLFWVGISCGCQIQPGINQAKLSIKQKTI